MTAADTRERVLASAADLAAREGFDTITTAKLSASSGVSNGSIYHHFGSKEGVLAALLAEIILDYQDTVLAVLDTHADSTHDSAHAGVLETVATHLRWTEQHRDQAMLLQLYREQVTRGAHREQVRDLNPSFPGPQRGLVAPAGRRRSATRHDRGGRARRRVRTRHRDVPSVAVPRHVLPADVVQRRVGAGGMGGPVRAHGQGAPMRIVDVWAQHPTLCFIQHDMFDSLRRWTDTERLTEELPLAMTIATMDAAGVHVSLLSAWHGPEGPLISNDEVAAFVAQAPDRLAGVASVDLRRPMAAVRELRRCVHDLGFVALRVVPWLWGWPPDDRRYYPLYAACVELGIPFCTQVGHTGPLRTSETGRPIPTWTTSHWTSRNSRSWPDTSATRGPKR